MIQRFGLSGPILGAGLRPRLLRLGRTARRWPAAPLNRDLVLAELTCSAAPVSRERPRRPGRQRSGRTIEAIARATHGEILVNHNEIRGDLGRPG